MFCNYIHVLIPIMSATIETSCTLVRSKKVKKYKIFLKMIMNASIRILNLWLKTIWNGHKFHKIAKIATLLDKTTLLRESKRGNNPDQSSLALNLSMSKQLKVSYMNYCIQLDSKNQKL